MKQEKIKMEKKKVKEKGITLVALVVTIIILLILAGVTLNSVLGNTGLLKRAQTAVDIYKSAQTNEEEQIQSIEKELDEYVNSSSKEDTSVNRGDLKIGDIVLYKPTAYVDNDIDKTDNGYTLLGAQSGYGTYSSDIPKKLDTPTNQTIPQETYVWKVLSIDEKGNVEIVGVPTSSMKLMYLQGALGYNNGVYLLDDICKKLYSNTELGTTARSIDFEDIQKEMSSTDKTENTPSGEIITCSGTNTYYPDIYACQKDSGVNVTNGENLKKEGISESDSIAEEIEIPINNSEVTSQGYKQTTNLTVKNTYLYKKQDTDYYTILFQSGTTYWLASRCSVCYSDSASFGLRYVDSSDLNGNGLFNLNGYCGSANNHICPVVSLGSNIQLTKSGENQWTPNK